MLIGLLLSFSAYALESSWVGEWKEVGAYRWLMIQKKYFIFRDCGRFSVLHSQENEVTLFRGSETTCLARGEHHCTIIPKSNSEITLNCGSWERSYTKEK